MSNPLKQIRADLAISRGFVPRITLPKATTRVYCNVTLERRARTTVLWGEYLELCNLSIETAPTADLCKNFLQYYVSSTVGQLSEMPTASSVYTFWKHFVGAMQLEKDLAEEGYRFVMNDMELSRETRPRYLVAGNDIDNLLEQLWRKDSFEYPCPKTRVQIALWLCLQAGSGTRGGEFLESSCHKGSNEALWYRDTMLYLERLADGSTSLRLKVGIRFRKGNRLHARDKNLTELTSVVFNEHEEPFRSVLYYFMAKAIADGAFKNVSTVDDILDAELHENERLRIFKWRDDIGDMPVLQAADSDSSSIKPITYDAVRCQTVELGRRAGYRHNITIHGIRRTFLNSVNNSYTIAARNQVAGHSGRMFEEAYQSNISRIDGYALMHGKDITSNHAKILQSMEFSHQRDAPEKIPAELRAELRLRPEYLEIDRELEELNSRRGQYGTEGKFRAARYVIYKRKARLDEKTFRKYKDERSDWHKKQCPGPSKFSILREFMPERNRLADSLFAKVTIRSPTGRQILQDLIHMAECNDYSAKAFYRAGEEPVDGRCPFNGCNRSMDSLPIYGRSSHIHTCHGRELKKRRHSKRSFAKFCYLCNRWILDEQLWNVDRKFHVNDPPIFCGAYYYHGLLLRPGLCPFCLSTCTDPDWTRLQTWDRQSKLNKHIELHIQDLDEDRKQFCPHPKCQANVGSSLIEHFEIFHHITQGLQNRAASKRRCSADDVEESPSKKYKESDKLDSKIPDAEFIANEDLTYGDEEKNGLDFSLTPTITFGSDDKENGYSEESAEDLKFDHAFENLEAFEFPDFVHTNFNDDEFDWLSL